MLYFYLPNAIKAASVGSVIYLPLNIFYSPPQTIHIFGQLWWKTLAMYIYAFPCQELFKCEALLAMPENAYYQKVSSYRLPNGKDMIIYRDQLFF